MMSRERRRKRREEKHQWAMTSGKWVSDENERKAGSISGSQAQNVENEAGPYVNCYIHSALSF